jgi:cell division septum initiation protein DivIVA
VLILGSLIVVPYFFKDKIVQIIKEQTNSQLNAIVDFDNDIELSLIRNFPNFTVGINQLSVANTGIFEGDTLLYLEHFSATLDVMSVIKGEQIKVKTIVLENGRINAIINKDGIANWDITKPSTDTATAPTDTSESKFNIALSKFEIINTNIIYDDKQGKMYAKLENLNHTLSGDFTQDNFLLDITASCEGLSYKMDGLTYLSKVKSTVDAKIDANMKEMKFIFKDNTFTLNELAFGFNGWIAMPKDDIDMDITFDAKQSEFKNFLSLVPAIYAHDFDKIQTTGKLAFNGFAKGTYNNQSLPSFAFNLSINDASFHYPELPAPVSNINIQFAATNPDGNIEHTLVNLSKFHFELMNDKFDMGLKASNIMKDPNLDAFMKGSINLDNISKMMPLDDGMKVGGLLVADMTAKGKMSTIEKEQYDQFDAKGNIALTKFMFTSKDLPKPYKIEAAALSFSPKIVTLNNFDANIGNTDIHMNGELSNFFAYTFGKGKLKGKLNFKSNQVDANEFLTPSTAATQTSTSTDTAALVAPEIPNNIDFVLNASIEKMLYTNMVIEQFIGTVTISNSKLSFQKMAMNTLGAAFTMDGYYETENPKKPSMSMNFGISNLEFKKAFETFNTVKKMAPVAENMTGTFSSQFTMQTALDLHLNPVYEELFAQGYLKIPKAGFYNVKVFNKAAEVLKNDKLKDPALTNVNIKFKVEKGRIYTEPFDMAVAGQKLTLSGSSGLDQSLDYIGKTTVPRSTFGSGNDAVNSMLAAANAKAGTNVKVSDNIAINLGIGGTFTNPKITTNLGDIAKNEANSVKNQLMNEADKKKKELEAKAKAEAERLKKEAEDKLKAEQDKLKKQAEDEANKAKAKAQAEADRLKKEAEAKAKAEQDRLRKQAEDEAKRKLKGVFGK